MTGKIFSLPKELYENRRLVFKLAVNDFRTRYAGSYLGIVWAFVQPVVTILVYWFVFSVGFKASTGDLGVPFVLYLVAGMVPWLFFQEALLGGTNALLEYNYLVKKVVFKISVLPLIKVLSAMFVHFFFVIFTWILYACYRRFPDLYYIQIIYYTGCVFVLVLSLSFLTCSVVVFFRDLTQIITIILQIAVWLYYVVSGYRDTFLWKHWFFEHPLWTLYFWGFTAVCFLLGARAFKKLKIHFADVL